MTSPEHLHLCQCQLQPSLPRARMTAEDVQDYRQPVEHGNAPRSLQGSLWEGSHVT